MTVRMNGTLRRCLVGSALCGLIVLTAVPAAMAQWLAPWQAASPGDIEQRLEAEGYMLVAPLHRRPFVYLADVSAGPGGYQRLVIDARSGYILQRFIGPARRWGPELAARGGEFAPPPVFVEPGPGGGFSTMPDGGPAAKSAYGGPSNVRIPAAISPVGSPDAPSATKPKPKSAPTGHNVPETVPPAQPGKPQGAGADAARNNPGAAAPAAAPLPPAPPKPVENQDSDKPKADSPPTEVENAPPAAPERASAAALPDLKPEAPKTEPSATAQSEGPAPQPSATRRPEGPAPRPSAPNSSAESSERSKVSIVPATLFE
jgi:hypothetical protein